MGKGDKKKKGGEDDIDLNAALVQNYGSACSALGLPKNEDLMKVLVPEEDPEAPIVQICFDKELGPGGTRALCSAILSRGSTMVRAGPAPAAYAPLKSMRFWSCGLKDAGAAAVAEVLVAGPPLGVGLAHVEMMDNHLGAPACRALGRALQLGGNTTLGTLRLDLNPAIGDLGAAELCRGLRSNGTLATLTMSFCGLGPAAAVALAEAAAGEGSALSSLDLRGNRLGSTGLRVLSEGAMRAPKLKSINVSDNGIGAESAEDNAAALEALGQALVAPVEKCALCDVDLTMNAVDAADAGVLLKYAGPDNAKLEQLLVDTALPKEIFDVLNRVGGKKKKKKGKGKKKKKK